jgi:hypothetical protein
MTSEFMTCVGQVAAFPPESSLIQVDGETPCWAWLGDGLAATLRRLRLITAILSLAWDTPWYLRDGPTEHIGTRWYGAAGPVSGSTYRWSETFDPSVGPLLLDLPDWFGDIERRLDGDQRAEGAIARALLIHHEALLCMREHPSLALLAFTSSIETLASRSDPLERCASCRAHIGSTRRFKHVVASVLPAEEAAMVVTAYDRRSRTVHDAKLHGREQIAGGWGAMSLYQPDEALRFEVGVMLNVQKASRCLLWRALDLPEPPSDPFRQGSATRA